MFRPPGGFSEARGGQLAPSHCTTHKHSRIPYYRYVHSVIFLNKTVSDSDFVEGRLKIYMSLKENVKIMFFVLDQGLL